MTAREYLDQYGVLKSKSRAIEAQLKELTDAYKSPEIDGLPRGSGLTSSTVQRIVERRQELTLALLDLEEKQTVKKAEIIDVIFKLESKEEVDVASMRYLELMKWEEIAETMHYSLRQVHYINGKVLAHVSSMI